MDTIFTYVALSLIASSALGTQHLSYTIDEEKISGTYIGNLLTDSNLSYNYTRDVTRILQFNILSKGLATELFKLQKSTGVLKTKVRIDREEVCPKLELCSLYVDVAVQPSAYFQVIKLNITINDLNDYTPTFDVDTIQKSLVESTQPGILFPILPAVDLDSPANAIVSYNLSGGDGKFALDYPGKTEGITDIRLMLIKGIDREKKDLYILELFAYDSRDPSLNGTQIIRIIITDANDNAPKLPSNSLEIEVAEDTPIDTPLINIEATDNDIGENGKLQYYFDRRTQRMYGNIFRLNRNNGSVTLNRKLDYEKQYIYSLKLNINDKGSFPLTSTAMLIVQVLDINDNKPIIKVNDETVSRGVTVTLEENKPADEFVAFISVEDYDQNLNKITDCELQLINPGGPLFRMYAFMENGYKIVTNEPLDREHEDIHVLKVFCTDKGTPPLSSYVNIEVKVNDVNDNSPEFIQQPYRFSIEENNRMNAFIGQIRARDRDIGPNGDISFHFCPNVDYAKDLTLDERSGSLIALSHYDHERIQIKHICVEARDHALTNSLATKTIITIRIIDVNDNQPEFNQSSYHFTVIENTIPVTPIGRASAHDFDSPPYNMFLFSIEANPYLDIDIRTGDITLKDAFNHEETPTYIVSAYVSSSEYLSHSDMVQIIVTVLDKNDHSPEISNPLSLTVLAPISSHVPVGYDIIQVEAHDKDSGDNAVLNYTLEEITEPGSFVIDPNDGQISTARKFKTVNGISRFRLEVTVYDNGEVPRNAATVFDVVINASIPYQDDSMAKGASFLRQDIHMILLAAAAATILVLMILLIICILCIRGKKKYETPVKQGYWSAEKEERYVAAPRRDFMDHEHSSEDEKMALSKDNDPDSPRQTDLYNTSLYDIPPPPDNFHMYMNAGVSESHNHHHNGTNGASLTAEQVISPPRCNKITSPFRPYSHTKPTEQQTLKHVTFQNRKNSETEDNMYCGRLIRNPGILLDGSDGTFV